LILTSGFLLPFGTTLKIAIIGTRGIPSNYGGFETFAEECAAGLVSLGHSVTVYGRSHYVPRSLKTHRGATLVVLPTLKWKYTDTLAHSCFSVVHALFQRFDAILICNAANAVYAWIPRIFGVPVILNVDGIERLRRKWNRLGRAYYHFCEYLSTRLPNAIVTDARVIENYYREQYGAASTFIPYGTRIGKPPGHDVLDKLGLRGNEYFLYVSRLEPENNAHLVVKSFENVRTSKRLLIVGDAPYSTEYIRKLRGTRDSRIMFPGAIYGEAYWQLQANAFCYIHATEVGGSHPALIEAMGQENIVVANGTPENIEVVGDAGVIYRKNSPDDLARRLQDIADQPEKYDSFRHSALERVRMCYSWESVIRRYEQLFLEICKKKSKSDMSERSEPRP
jgi:glycosyltransferase involved in cell wall biosynthesis